MDLYLREVSYDDGDVVGRRRRPADALGGLCRERPAARSNGLSREWLYTVGVHVGPCVDDGSQCSSGSSSQLLLPSTELSPFSAGTTPSPSLVSPGDSLSPRTPSTFLSTPTPFSSTSQQSLATLQHDSPACSTLDGTDPVYCHRCPKQFTDILQLRIHIESDHRCQCPCDACLGVSPGPCQVPRLEFACPCGFRSMNHDKWTEHRRNLDRRQVQCRCGKILREDRVDEHFKNCRQGSKQYVCLRQRTDDEVQSHRLVFTNQEDFLRHFNTKCKGRRRGRPKKRKSTSK